MDYKRVSKRKSKIARCRANAILSKLHTVLKEKYVFSTKLVGSAAWGTIIEDGKGEYDLDYQILLTKRSRQYQENGLNNPTEIKRDFISAFNRIKNENEIFEDSTTVITLINKDNKPYHIDFVIIKLIPNNDEIIRRNNKKETPSINEYTWNRLPGYNDAYTKFKQLNINEKMDLIENYIIPRKYKEKHTSDNQSSKVSSSELFIQEVNNYVNRK